MITDDLETLIESKKREINSEKIILGLAPRNDASENHECNENVTRSKKAVSLKEEPSNVHHEADEAGQHQLYSAEETIPPELERYIRRYCGLPAMLKAGEYSPNNPLLRAALPGGHALLGLGEYERRRNTLRKVRQAQYRHHLDLQAKKKQEAKEQAERERREAEEREREREERQRRLLLERDSPRRRASLCALRPTKVDTAVQVGGVSSPLSVAVQTDDADLYRPQPERTRAERELSPRAAEGGPSAEAAKSKIKAKPISDLRHSYMPSILDSEAIQQRNAQAEQEAAARRHFYQQELRNQILEQQRIREERKSREKMLEQAEMRKLEEQLRLLKSAQEMEIGKQRVIDTSMRDNAIEFEAKRVELQREIEAERRHVLRPLVAPSLPARCATTRAHDTLHYTRQDTFQPIQPAKDKRPYSFNIPDNSIFSENYDVDTYLRRNLNFRDKYDEEIENIKNRHKTSAGNKERDKNERNVAEKSHAPIDFDNLSIPVLRHSPKLNFNAAEDDTKLSDAMRRVDDKWKVPAVQKNILKALPSEDGRNISILTQLGSIRRQLQLEQLKLDKMLSKDET